MVIAPPLGAWGSNTGGGQLRMIGPLVDADGGPLDFAPTAGLDIYTNGGSNVGVAVSEERILDRPDSGGTTIIGEFPH